MKENFINFNIIFFTDKTENKLSTSVFKYLISPKFLFDNFYYFGQKQKEIGFGQS